MYPGHEVLAEVGRVAIAGARLDLQAGLLWHHLDRDVPFETSRRKPGREQRKKLVVLATQRLCGDLQQAVLAAVASVEAAQERRNEVIHQDWVLRGRDAMRSVTEIAAVADQDLSGYLEDWQRQAKESSNWQRVPAREIHVVPAHGLEQLRAVERHLAAVTATVSELVFAVASSRETGKPPGYVHPTSVGRPTSST